VNKGKFKLIRGHKSPEMAQRRVISVPRL